MAYVEGFVLAAPEGGKETYLKHAAQAAPLFKEFGCTRMMEAWGDDVPEGQLTDFRKAVKAKDGEAIVFSWLEYPSREVRDAANKKLISDPRMEAMGSEMPFDGQRMIVAGFELIHETGEAGRAGYVDGTVVAVPAAAREAYRAWAAKTAEIFREYGASRVVDAWGDDVPDGKVTDYKGAVQAAEGEQVAYGWIEWPSKAARDEAWAKVMADPRMQALDMPFDGKRMIYGGFAPILDV